MKTRLSFFYPSLLLTLSMSITSCATKTIIETKQTTPTQLIASQDMSRDITVTMFAADKSKEQQWLSYQDFAKKGFVPLHIEFKNHTNDKLTLRETQYAICNPAYKRTRRTEAKDMALCEVELYEQEATAKEGFFARLKRKMKTRKIQKAYKKIEFDTKTIPPKGTIRGWLYFKMKEGEFTAEELFNELRGYQLEIACVKNVDTNVVNNFYLELDPLIDSLIT